MDSGGWGLDWGKWRKKLPTPLLFVALQTLSESRTPQTYCCTLSLMSDSGSVSKRFGHFPFKHKYPLTVCTHSEVFTAKRGSVFSYKCTIFHCVGGVKASLTLAHHCIISNCIVTYRRTCNCTNVNNLSDSNSRPLKLTFQKPAVGEPSVT